MNNQVRHKHFPFTTIVKKIMQMFVANLTTIIVNSEESGGQVRACDEMTSFISRGWSVTLPVTVSLSDKIPTKLTYAANEGYWSIESLYKIPHPHLTPHKNKNFRQLSQPCPLT